MSVAFTQRSGGRKGVVSLQRATAVAMEVVQLLRPACQRIEIAGSIRRGLEEIGDVEIVCQPLIVSTPDPTTLWGHPLTVNKLLEQVDLLIERGILAEHEDPKHGERYIRLRHVASGVQIDLFCVLPPAEWGLVYLVRTGPADYSRWFVTEARARGWHVAKGALHPGLGHRDPAECACPVQATPEEEDAYSALGLLWCPPAIRRV